jgi:hypothetical protein
MDVLSNLPFVVVGFVGAASTVKILRKRGGDVVSLHYLIFFIGILLTGMGSAYYHFEPSNDSLFWDRLAMTLAFTGLFCSVIAELISRKASFFLLFPLFFVNIGSVFYWDWTEGLGRGDLRLYGLVQFLPVLLIPLILVMYKAQKGYIRCLVGLFIFYFLAKILEVLDHEVFQLQELFSGHTLKHLSAAAGTCFVLKASYSHK